MKRQRRRRGNRAFEEEPNPEFQVAPMADLLFVLLVFFMSITSVEVLRTAKGIDLPTAGQVEKGRVSHQVIVNVAWVPAQRSGSLRVDGQPFNSPADLAPALAARLGRDPLLRVLIRADRAVEYAYLSEVLKACGAARVPNVTFAVLAAPHALAGG